MIGAYLICALLPLSAAQVLSASIAAAPTPTQTQPSIQIYQSGISFAPSPLPSPFAASKGDQIFAAFKNLGRTTIFQTNATIDFGQYVEAEGMVRIGEDRYFISNNLYTALPSRYPSPVNGTDRSPGSGTGLLTVVDGTGQRIAEVNLSVPNALEYHNGGIDYDGRYIWANLAQYRPNSTFSLVRIDPLTLDFEYVAHFQDHAGGPIVDTASNNIYNLNWGSRNATVLNLADNSTAYPSFVQANAVIQNPSYFVDYQDCKYLGEIAAYNNTPCAFCSGIADYGTTSLGGLAIINVETLAPIFEVPLVQMSANGFPLTQNPSDVDFVDGHLRFYFFPDQVCTNCTMYIVDALVDSPYEY